MFRKIGIIDIDSGAGRMIVDLGGAGDVFVSGTR